MQFIERLKRKTKIICTIGPVTSSIEDLRRLHDVGMDIARLNMSHGNQDTHMQVIENIKNINQTALSPISILLDTQGPEIRTGDLEENYFLHVGEEIDVNVVGGEKTEGKNTLIVNYKDLIKQVKAGDRITVDNGLINLDVIKKTTFGLKCRVVDGGLIKSRRHINLPGIRINLPSITEKDEKDISFGIKNDIDFIALSFVRSAKDVKRCKELIKKEDGHAHIIAKIEDHFGVENYGEIIESAHGIMIARGDLGVEVPIEELPIIQRRIIKKTAEQGKFCIVATHLLESMIENPLPTRAEVTDVANAVYEESDCIMLSGESSIGKYPFKSVEYLHKISMRTEKSGGIGWARNRSTNHIKEKTCRAAVELADDQRADAILVVTRSGYTANLITSFHPKYSMVFAFANMTTVRRKLIVNRGCYPFQIEFSNDPEKMIQTAVQLIKKRKLLPSGATIIVVSDIIAGEERVDTIQIRSLP